MFTHAIALVLAGTAGAVQIHPFGRDDLCVDVQGANFAPGTPVQIWECNGTPAQNWEFGAFGNTNQWRVVGTDYCMKFDGGGRPGVKMILNACDAFYPNNGWALKATNHWIINNSRYGTYALDLTDGGEYNGNQLQIWNHDACNANQLWAWA